jgi:ribonuclease Z
MINFVVRQLNSPFDDSVFFVRNVYRKTAFLLDCGKLGGLEHAETLSLGDIFVSHTHIDHFVGFDRILRGALNGDQRIRMFGPPGFIDNVDGKFRSYVWNLVDGYEFSVLVTELHPDGNHKRALFEAKNGFKPEFVDIVSDISDIDDGFTLEFEFFDHRTLSMGYRINEPTHYVVEAERLPNYSYRAGKWLSELKKALAAGDYEAVLAVSLTDGGVAERSVAQLNEELISIKPPQSITYITDCAPTAENIEKAVKFAANSTLLIIEAPFLEEDMAHAVEKNHLALNLSKEIFWRSKSEFVRFTHFASRYERDKELFFGKLYEKMAGRIYTK